MEQSKEVQIKIDQLNNGFLLKVVYGQVRILTYCKDRDEVLQAINRETLKAL